MSSILKQGSDWPLEPITEELQQADVEESPLITIREKINSPTFYNT
jgi:hypothetical protein